MKLDTNRSLDRTQERAIKIPFLNLVLSQRVHKQHCYVAARDRKDLQS